MSKPSKFTDKKNASSQPFLSSGIEILISGDISDFNVSIRSLKNLL